MRFHAKFTRRVGGAGPVPVLGSDAAPTVVADKADDCCMTTHFTDPNSLPCHRIAVGYGYAGAGTPKPLLASLYVWDDLSELWFLISSNVILYPGRITFIESLGVQPPPFGSGLAGTGGSIEAQLVVAANALDDDGTYTFVMAPDQTTPGAADPPDYHVLPGVSGTESIAAGKRVVGITAYAALGVATATVQVGADAAAPVPEGGSLTLVPPDDSLRGEVDIVFTDTTGYVVETVE